MLCNWRLAFLFYGVELVTNLASAQTRPQYYWACQATVQGPRGAFKSVSNVFPAAPGATLSDARIGNPAWVGMVASWDRYLLHKYLPDEEKKRDQQSGQGASWHPSGGPGTCVIGTLAQAQAIHDPNVKAGATEEDWVYSPDQTAAAPPAARSAAPPKPEAAASCAPVQTIVNHKFVMVTPEGCPQPAASSTPPSPSAAPPKPLADDDAPASTSRRAQHPQAASSAIKQAARRYAICYGHTSEASPTMYVSANFEVTTADSPAWTRQFREFLMEKYGVRVGVSCRMDLSIVSSQNAVKQYTAISHAGKTVETNWKYDPGN